jgi:hypothetical protein
VVRETFFDFLFLMSFPDEMTGLSAEILNKEILNNRRLNVLHAASRMPSTARVRLAVTALLVLMLVQEGGASSAPVLGGGVPPGIFYTIHSLLCWRNICTVQNDTACFLALSYLVPHSYNACARIISQYL